MIRCMCLFVMHAFVVDAYHRQAWERSSMQSPLCHALSVPVSLHPTKCQGSGGMESRKDGHAPCALQQPYTLQQYS